MKNGRPITKKVDKIIAKVEQDCHMCSHNDAEKHPPLRSFKPFEENWLQKEARCLSATRIDAKEIIRLYFHWQKSTET